MPEPKLKSHGVQLRSDRGHPMPRRITPEQSITLGHHRLAQNTAYKSPPHLNVPQATTPPRRNSSGESHDTGHSDPKKWFDKSNKNPVTTYNANNMDVDPPFFQKETDSSNEDLRLDVPPLGSSVYPYAAGSLQVPGPRPTMTHSSSADDYRSVIDDLTIENKRLKEELKRYKPFGAEAMKKDRLFDIRFHGLNGTKRRELEATLRKFAAGLEGSSETTSQRKRSSKHVKPYSSGGSFSKHASSSSSQSRPVDSAYASMSTGPHSSGTSLHRPSIASRARSSEQKVEHYLEEIPEGLYPKHFANSLTDKDKMKLVVKKLEQLFTGRITGRNIHRNQSMPSMETQVELSIAVPASLEPAREAQIQADAGGRKARSRDNLSISNSNGDQTESGGNGNASGSGSGGRSGNNTSPPTSIPPEQRPTRPRDLDPDRIQVPSENMEYLRHLGAEVPELLAGTKSIQEDVSPDADGWVYLNLLSNLAQLHILNVSPEFIRRAVTTRSTKFQLSRDGRKIRWRGGTEGTKFSGESSGDNSQRSPTTDEDDDGSDKNGQRKRLKTAASGDGLDTSTAPSTKNHSKFGPQIGGSSESFHYKPLFVHQPSSMETSVESESQDSYQVEDSNLGNNSRWNLSGSGSSPRKKRRADGAIVYYSGAPFCTDLSGDPGDASPTTYMTSTGQGQESFETDGTRPTTYRTLSGASFPFRPITDRLAMATHKMIVDDMSAPDLTTDDTDEASDLESDFPWSENADAKIIPELPTLEASGLGGVSPEDHFAVLVLTRRSYNPEIEAGKSRPLIRRVMSDETTDSIVPRLATMSTESPRPALQPKDTPCPVEIDYTSYRVRRLEPAPLPEPASFYPPFTETSESDDDDILDSEADDDEDEEVLASSVEEVLSKKANPHQSDNTYPDEEDFESGDEEDEADADSEDSSVGIPQALVAPLARPGQKVSPELRRKSGDLSSAATAGGVESGYSSSMEDE